MLTRVGVLVVHCPLYPSSFRVIHHPHRCAQGIRGHVTAIQCKISQSSGPCAPCHPFPSVRAALAVPLTVPPPLSSSSSNSNTFTVTLTSIQTMRIAQPPSACASTMIGRQQQAGSVPPSGISQGCTSSSTQRSHSSQAVQPCCPPGPAMCYTTLT